MGLLVVALAVLPGSTYTWAFERQVSAFGVTLADRTLRFIAISLIFNLLFAWPAFAAYQEVFSTGRFGYMDFGAAWVGALCVCVLPAFVGAALGGLYATRTERIGWRWIRKYVSPVTERKLLHFVLGRTPAPRAWDDLFSDRPTTFIRVRTVDGFWLAGSFADNSYAGGFPNETDLFLEEAWEIDSDGTLGDRSLGYPVYIAAHQIAWLELVRPVAEVERGRADD
ncbi:MAG: hypothetical protein JJE02_06105 [Propionibacteriales bacterium]|nr:hypothetical protein [Propionibacteriales bacterium]